MGRGRVLLHLVTDLVAVHSGHLDVGHQEIGAVLDGERERLGAVVGVDEVVAGLFEDRPDVPVHQWAVVRDEDESALSGDDADRRQDVRGLEGNGEEARQARRERAVAIGRFARHQDRGDLEVPQRERIATRQPSGHERGRRAAGSGAQGVGVLDANHLMAGRAQGLAQRFGQRGGSSGDDDAHGGMLPLLEP